MSEEADTQMNQPDDVKTTARITIVSAHMGVAELKVWIAEHVKGDGVKIESLEVSRDEHTYPVSNADHL